MSVWITILILFVILLSIFVGVEFLWPLKTKVEPVLKPEPKTEEQLAMLGLAKQVENDIYNHVFDYTEDKACSDAKIPAVASTNTSNLEYTYTSIYETPKDDKVKNKKPKKKMTKKKTTKKNTKGKRK